MDSIPKSFWHAASFALIAFTFGFLYISLQAGSLTVRYKELEISTQSVNAFRDSLNRKEQVIDQREKKVAELEELLNNRTAEISGVGLKLSGLTLSPDPEVEFLPITKEIASFVSDPEFESRLSSQKNLLENIKQQQQLVDMELAADKQRLFDDKNLGKTVLK